MKKRERVDSFFIIYAEIATKTTKVSGI